MILSITWMEASFDSATVLRPAGNGAMVVDWGQILHGVPPYWFSSQARRPGFSHLFVRSEVGLLLDRVVQDLPSGGNWHLGIQWCRGPDAVRLAVTAGPWIQPHSGETVGPDWVDREAAPWLVVPEVMLS